MKYNFEFINHKQITTKFLWNDGIHLLDTGKSVLGQNFVNKVSNFFSQKQFLFNGFSLSIDFENKTKQSSTGKTIVLWLFWAIIITSKNRHLHCQKEEPSTQMLGVRKWKPTHQTNLFMSPKYQLNPKQFWGGKVYRWQYNRHVFDFRNEAGLFISHSPVFN